MTDKDPSPASSSALRVLIVDDDESITKTFGWMLDMLGHQSCVARDGASALEKARTFRPDVILLDISLPGMNGYDVCKMIRAEPGLANCVFIAQTGWSQPEHRERSKKAGFDHHWVKPIPMERLEELLRSLSHKTAA